MLSTKKRILSSQKLPCIVMYEIDGKKCLDEYSSFSSPFYYLNFSNKISICCCVFLYIIFILFTIRGFVFITPLKRPNIIKWKTLQNFAHTHTHTRKKEIKKLYTKHN